MRTSWPSIPAIALGLAAALAVLAANLLHLDEYAELRALDLRFRYGSRLQPSDAIVHVDIDDHSIAKLGRWPWPRQQIADVIGTLKSCGARAVAMDILFSEPQKLRYEIPQSPDGPDGGDETPLPVFDDAALVEAIALSPASAVPMHVRPGADRSADGFETSPPGTLQTQGLLELDRLAVEVETAGAFPILRGRIVPPLAIFARAAGTTGFVTFEPDKDGLTRRVPLLATDGRKVFPQFALALALSELRRAHGPCRLRAGEQMLVAEFGDGTRRVMPVDGTGRMLVQWLSGGLGLGQIPAAVAVELADKRRVLAQGPARENRLRLELVSLAKKIPPALEQDYSDLLDLVTKMTQATRDRLALEREWQRASLSGPGRTPDRAALDALRRQEQEIETRVGALAQKLTEPMRQEAARNAILDPAGEEFEARTAKARAILSQLDALPARKRALADEIRELESQVTARVAGRICLIGSTTTAAADFVPTPKHSYTPGVQVHSSALRTILEGRFIAPAPRWANVLAIVLAGLAMSVLAAWWPALRSSAALVVLAGLFVAGNFYLFRQEGLWLAAVSPLAAMGGSFLVVTVYRQLTEERAKRRIKNLFSQALSPAVVEQLIEDPHLAEVGGKKSEVTLLFSDLAGFTPLSERLGPQETVKLLNRYFDRVTDVIQIQQGGYLNKFLGDGVFSFFGAPVVQTDHPRRAVLAAVACQEQVDLLNRQLRQERADGAQLTVRMGLVSGTAMVGNYGSTQRMDYTAIGDSVNLASRLEGANKFFGTRILLADSTAQQCGEGFILRPMGEFRVVGVRHPVKAWEAIAPPQLAALGGPDTLPHVADFRRAMECLAAAQLEEAAEILAKLEQAWPQDRPTKIFRRLAHEAIANRSNPAWQPDCSESKGSVQIIWPWKQI